MCPGSVELASGLVRSLLAAANRSLTWQRSALGAFFLSAVKSRAGARRSRVQGGRAELELGGPGFKAKEPSWSSAVPGSRRDFVTLVNLLAFPLLRQEC